MYNYSLNLAYQKNDSDTQYRKELLDAFKLKIYTEEINTKILSLFKENKNFFTEIIECIKNDKTNKLSLISNSDDIFFFTMLFSWEYFYHTHELLKSIHLNEKISIINKKQEIIKNKINCIKK